MLVFFSALNIPFESEEKQKFQITKSSNGILHAKRKYILTLDNLSLSSQQLVPNTFFNLANALTSISEGY